MYGARPATAVPGPKSTAKPSGPVDAWMQGGTQKPSLLSSNFGGIVGAAPTNDPPRKRVIPKPSARNNDDIDELDDLMGGGGDRQDDSFLNSKKAEPRDTLGFLKKSEEEKKRREEDKKLALSQKDAAYKQLTEITHNLIGYETDTIYPYSTGNNISS